MKKSPWIKWGAFGILAALLLAAALFSYNAAHIFGLSNPFALGGEPAFTTPTPTPVPGAPGTPSVTPGPGAPAVDPLAGYEAWSGASRVNVLVMGLDYRDWEAGEGAPRSDTMILLTIDPLTNSAGMLSIPRDLWVPIPGFDAYQRINTAYRWGELYDLPGGGPALASLTVEQLLGIKIDFYAQVDFSAFERMIDEIGGVKIDVPYNIEVDPIGPGNHKFLKPGVQVLPGHVALAYARARNTPGGDFDRAQRQQQVVLAIRHQILSWNLIPILLTKSGALYAELSTGVDTNMTLHQAVQLGLLARNIPLENIKKGVIGAEQILFMVSPEGDQVLKPIPDKIRQLRDSVFTAPTLLSQAAQSATPAERMQEEAANIAIYNGTYASGLATRTAEYLAGQGARISPDHIGDAGQAYAATTIIDHSGKPYTVAFLVSELGIQDYRIFFKYDPANSVQVEVFLGNDWASNNTLP